MNTGTSKFLKRDQNTPCGWLSRRAPIGRFCLISWELGLKISRWGPQFHIPSALPEQNIELHDPLKHVRSMHSLLDLQWFMWATHCNNLMQPAACLSQRTLHSKCLACWEWPMWKWWCHFLISFTSEALGCSRWPVRSLGLPIRAPITSKCWVLRLWFCVLSMSETLESCFAFTAGMVLLQPLALHIWELSSVTGLQHWGRFPLKWADQSIQSIPKLLHFAPNSDNSASEGLSMWRSLLGYVHKRYASQIFHGSLGECWGLRQRYWVGPPHGRQKNWRIGLGRLTL